MNTKMRQAGIIATMIIGASTFATSANAATVPSEGRTWVESPDNLLGVLTSNHTDPCPGNHIPVYNENSNVQLPHFICGPLKGDTGPAGPKGEKGADSTVAGPPGKDGDKGEPGKDGTDSTVAGPAGPQGLPGKDGADSNIPGPKGDTGPQGEIGPQGPAGADGKSTSSTGLRGPAGKDGVTKTVVVYQHEDGTTETETISGLPKTGNNSNSALWGAVGLGLFTVGGMTMFLMGRVRRTFANISDN